MALYSVIRYDIYGSNDNHDDYYNYYYGYTWYKEEADKMTWEEAKTVCENESKFWGSEFAFSIVKAAI